MKELSIKNLNKKTSIDPKALRGMLLLANVANDLADAHDFYMPGDCALAKLNLLLPKIRKNPKHHSGFTSLWSTRLLTCLDNQTIVVALGSDEKEEFVQVIVDEEKVLHLGHRKRPIHLVDNRLKPEAPSGLRKLIADVAMQTFINAVRQPGTAIVGKPMRKLSKQQLRRIKGIDAGLRHGVVRRKTLIGA